MNGLHDRIIELRRAGRSLKDIAAIVGCAKSTAGSHCRGVDIADMGMIAQSIRNNAKNASLKNVQKWDNSIGRAIEEAKAEWAVVKNDPELMGFLGLYWGEGTKKSAKYRTPPIAIANSDPGIIIKCKKCFDRLSADNKYRCNLIIYDDLNKAEMKVFWETITGVEVKRIEVRKTHNLRRCKYGTCYLRFSNYKLFHKIMTWIECWRADGES